jgi:hypothetical protein
LFPLIESIVERNNESDKFGEGIRSMPSASHFVLEIRLETIDGLIDDWILVFPTKYGNILLKFGEVSRRGGVLSKGL